MRYAKFTFSAIERVDLLKAWIGTSLTFAIYFLVTQSGVRAMLSTGITGFLLVILFAAITAGIGFLGHELMHKAAASYFGVHSEFRSNDQMLVISIIISFFGIIFAAPGAVQIYHHINKRENGIISAAGPAANIVLALVFLPLALFTTGILHVIGTYGLYINALLGVFNLIPLWDFDGLKVLAWNKIAYFGLLIAGALMVVVAFSI